MSYLKIAFYVDLQYIVYPVHLIKAITYFNIPIYRYQLAIRNKAWAFQVI